MFSISSFRNESGCFEQEKCPRVYLSSLRTKCTQDMLIFKVYFWRSKKLRDVVRRLTWSLTERERATCEDEWLNTSRISLISEPWLRSTSIDVILAYFSKGFKVEQKFTQWSSPDGVWAVLWTARHHPPEQPRRVDQAPEEHTVQQQSSHHADNLFWHC